MDIASETIENILPLGYKSWGELMMDPSDKDGMQYITIHVLHISLGSCRHFFVVYLNTLFENISLNDFLSLDKTFQSLIV